MLTPRSVGVLQGVSPLPQISSLEAPHRGFRRMPADYEMMIASSPPVFSHSPPVSSCIAANYNYLCNGLAYNNANGGRRRQQQMNPKLRVQATGEQAVAAAVLANKLQALAPRLRPCLVVKPDEPLEACKHKKRVVFADDKGLSLTQVSTFYFNGYLDPCGFSPHLGKILISKISKKYRLKWFIFTKRDKTHAGKNAIIILIECFAVKMSEVVSL